MGQYSKTKLTTGSGASIIQSEHDEKRKLLIWLIDFKNISCVLGQKN